MDWDGLTCREEREARLFPVFSPEKAGLGSELSLEISVLA